MKNKNLIYMLPLALLTFMLFSKCKKDDKKPATTATTPTPIDSTVYYVKYDFHDTTSKSYNFTTKTPFSSFGTEDATCRIGLPNNFYSGIDIELISPSGVQLKYNDIKALEGKFVPYWGADKITARITTVTPNPYYTEHVDSTDQHGSFYIEKVTLLPSEKSAPTNKILDVKGSFSCNMWPDSTTIKNGTFLIKYTLWSE